MGTYIKCGDNIKSDDSLNWITIIEPTMSWFKIVKVPTFDLYEVTFVNDEYIDNSSNRVSQLFNNTWIFI